MSKGMSGHHSARPTSEVWLTPPWLLEAIGAPDRFDLDPCAALEQPWPTARHHMTANDDGLAVDWFGKVFCNPPYTHGVIGKWLSKMASHGNGIALIFARTDTMAFHQSVWNACDALLFLRGRLNFHVPADTWYKEAGRNPIFVPAGSAYPKNAGAPSVLCAYCPEDADNLATCGIDGEFVALRLRSLIHGFEKIGTWADEVQKAMAQADGPVKLSWLYEKLAHSPKAKRNRHYKAKIRQTLQLGDFIRIDDGVWVQKKLDFDG